MMRRGNAHAEEKCWRAHDAETGLTDRTGNTIHLWRASLDVVDEKLRALEALLSPG